MATDKKIRALTTCIINCLGLRYSENPSDFPKVRFAFAKLVAQDSQLTIHKPLAPIMKNVIIVLLIVCSSKTFACTCLYKNITDRYTTSDFVVTARILKITPIYGDSNYLIADLEILDQFKGEKINTIRIHQNKTMCNIYTPVGTSWLIFAKNDNSGILTFGYCSGAEQLDKKFNTDNRTRRSKYYKRNLERKLAKLRVLKAEHSSVNNPKKQR